MGLMGVIQVAPGTDPTTSSMACLLLKKLFLDDRKSEQELEQLSAEDIAQMKGVFTSLLSMGNIEAEPMSLLRRKAEILCKIHRKQETYVE